AKTKRWTRTARSFPAQQKRRSSRNARPTPNPPLPLAKTRLWTRTASSSPARPRPRSSRSAKLTPRPRSNRAKRRGVELRAQQPQCKAIRWRLHVEEWLRARIVGIAQKVRLLLEHETGAPQFVE